MCLFDASALLFALVRCGEDVHRVVWDLSRHSPSCFQVAIRGGDEAASVRVATGLLVANTSAESATGRIERFIQEFGQLGSPPISFVSVSTKDFRLIK